MLKSFFQLVRIPTIFSAFSNAYAGYWIGGGGASTRSLILGMLAASLYLMAGMALNDIADYKVDKAERPGRPLPSGAISLPAAWMFSFGMLALALLCQWFANPVAACVGVLLIIAIFLYNFLLKGTFLGPFAMGACRVLNLLGGIALCADGVSDLLFLPFSAYWALGSIGAYIVIVTFLARDEVFGNSVARVRRFFAGFALWAGLWVIFLTASSAHFPVWNGLASRLITSTVGKLPIPFAGFAVGRLDVPLLPLVSSVALLGALLLHFRLLSAPFRHLRREPDSPAATGKTIGALLRSLPMTDVVGMLGASVFWPWALLGLVWMLPGPFLAKRFYST